MEKQIPKIRAIVPVDPPRARLKASLQHSIDLAQTYLGDVQVGSPKGMQLMDLLLRLEMAVRKI